MIDNSNTEGYIEEQQDEYSLVEHSVTYKQKERSLRKKRKKQKRIKMFLSFLTFLFVIFLGYEFVLLPQWYLPENTFSSSNPEIIQVINNKLAPSKIIYDSLKKIKVKKIPIFFVSVKPIKKELYKIPVIKNVYIRRYGFPARMQILIREKTPTTVIKTDLKAKPIALYTQDGTLVTDRQYTSFAENKKTLKILAKPFKNQKEWTAGKVKYIEKIAKAVETYSLEKVQYIDLRNPDDVYVRIKTTNIRLGLLDSSVFDRIKRIYTILPQISGVHGQIRYIDLSWDKVNYLKMKENKRSE